MPIKRGILTGVPAAQIVKATQQERVMSQDAELMELEALLVQEDEQLGAQEEMPAPQDDAAVAMVQDAQEEEEEEENIEAALAALGAEDGEEEVEPAPVPEPAAPAAEAAAQPEAVACTADSTPDADGPMPDAPSSEPTPAPASKPAPADAATSSSAVAKPQLGKRKGGLVVKKADPKPSASSGPTVAPVAPTAVPSGAKQAIKVNRTPPADKACTPATAAAPAVEPAEEAPEPAAEAAPGAQGEQQDAEDKENGGNNIPAAVAADSPAAAVAPPPAKKQPALPKPKAITPAASKPAGPAASKSTAADVKPTAPAAAKPAAKTKAAGKRKADDGSSGSGEGAAAPPVKVPKKPLNAYMCFSQAKRAEIKAEHPDLDPKALLSKIAELYKALTPEEKAHYEAAAVADKERYKAEMEAAGPEGLLAPKPKVKRTKTAYNLFCDSRLPQLRADNPQAGMGELSKQVAALWKDVTPEEKAKFQAQAKTLKDAAKEAGGEEAAASKPQKKQSKPASAGAGRKKGKSAKVAAAEEPAQEEEEEEQAAQEDESDDEEERMNVDWEVHPAECILSHTTTGKYVVLRQGLGIREYGLVEASRVKAQRLGHGAADAASACTAAAGSDQPCPVSLAMLEEYEAFDRAFRREVHDNTERGELLLADLPEDTMLECCEFLGKMRNPTYELARPAKGDALMKVPLLATCRIFQRLLMAERQRTARLQERMLELEAAAGGSSQPAAARPATVHTAGGKVAAADADTPGAKARQAGIEA